MADKPRLLALWRNLDDTPANRDGAAILSGLAEDAEILSLAQYGGPLESAVGSCGELRLITDISTYPEELPEDVRARIPEIRGAHRSRLEEFGADYIFMPAVESLKVAELAFILPFPAHAPAIVQLSGITSVESWVRQHDEFLCTRKVAAILDRPAEEADREACGAACSGGFLYLPPPVKGTSEEPAIMSECRLPIEERCPVKGKLVAGSLRKYINGPGVLWVRAVAEICKRMPEAEITFRVHWERADEESLNAWGYICSSFGHLREVAGLYGIPDRIQFVDGRYSESEALEGADLRLETQIDEASAPEAGSLWRPPSPVVGFPAMGEIASAGLASQESTPPSLADLAVNALKNPDELARLRNLTDARRDSYYSPKGRAKRVLEMFESM